MTGRSGTLHVLRLAVLELGPGPESVPRARRHARRVIREWGYPEAAEDGEVVVSELVANAVRASAAGLTPVGLRLTAGPGRLVVEVRDRSPEPPRPRAAGWLDEGGRGLRVVAGLSRRWGYCFAGGWKTVWAELGTGEAGPGAGHGDDAGQPIAGSWDEG